MRDGVRAMPRTQVVAVATFAVLAAILVSLQLRLALSGHPGSDAPWPTRAHVLWQLHALTFGSESVLDWVRGSLAAAVSSDGTDR